MPRANTRTWLPLERWREIIGIHPLHFAQLDGGSLTPNTVCGEVFYQFDWQHSDRVGREEIAQAIRQAELEIAREVGYNLIPDWTVDERLPYPRPGVPELYGSGVNQRWQEKSIETPRGWVVSGGIRAKTLIEAGAAVTRSDQDGDTYDETCTVSVVTSVTDVNQIAAFYPAKNGADAWEIRPITVSISGGIATITFKSWQIVAANQLERIDPQPLAAANASSYETTVDVYRVYNDPQTQVQFMWENYPDLACSCTSSTCVACNMGTQAGCFHLRDPRMGFVVPSPASWDSDNEQFNKVYYAACREPDQVRLWYYSGFRDQSLQRPYVDMSPYWEYAVAYYAASKLERPVCGCSNVNQFIEKWRVDVTSSERGGTSFFVPENILTNRLGTSAGALYAYRRIHQNGVIINK